MQKLKFVNKEPDWVGPSEKVGGCLTVCTNIRKNCRMNN